MTVYKAIAGQSIYDVCLQTYGSLDYLYKLLTDNGILSIIESVFGGQVFVWDDSLVIDQGVNTAFAGMKRRYATDITNNGSVFYVVDNIPGSLAPNNGAVPYPDGTGSSGTGSGSTNFVTVFGTFYIASTDGETSMVINDIIGAPITGSDIVQIERETKPLHFSEYTWTKETATLTLVGISLSAGEQLAVLYKKITL